MSFTKRGILLVKALEKYSVDKSVYFDASNVLKKVHIEFLDADEDCLRAKIIVDTSMCNGYDILHGGYIASVIDVMCLYARVGKTLGKMGLTTNMYINFLNVATVGDGIIAEAKVVDASKSSITETILYKDNGVLVAKGTACFKHGTEKQQMDAINKIGFDILKADD